MVSATSLASYLYCPRKLFMSKVLLVEEAPKEALVKGTIWHATYEQLHLEEKAIVCALKTASYLDISDAYRRAIARFFKKAIIIHRKELESFSIKMIDLFNEYWPFFEEEAKRRALNVSSFMEKTGFFGSELWDVLTPKILAERYFSSKKLNLSGIIDCIEVHQRNGQEYYVPVELKTGKSPAKGMWEGHRVQLAAYLLLLEEEGKIVSEGILRYKGAPDDRILMMNSLLRKEIFELIILVQQILSSFEIPGYIENKNKCVSCPFKEVCYDVQQMQQLLITAKSRQQTLPPVQTISAQ